MNFPISCNARSIFWLSVISSISLGMFLLSRNYFAVPELNPDLIKQVYLHFGLENVDVVRSNGTSYGCKFEDVVKKCNVYLNNEYLNCFIRKFIKFHDTCPNELYLECRKQSDDIAKHHSTNKLTKKYQELFEFLNSFNDRTKYCSQYVTSGYLYDVSFLRSFTTATDYMIESYNNLKYIFGDFSSVLENLDFIKDSIGQLSELDASIKAAKSTKNNNSHKPKVQLNNDNIAKFSERFKCMVEKLKSAHKDFIAAIETRLKNLKIIFERPNLNSEDYSDPNTDEFFKNYANMRIKFAETLIELLKDIKGK